ncbi:VWA domain-containing protein [Bradyrhizobium prioriisuperbiae]|uniref:VWA domain-containing protein n=1 Tax=Bradyrhizobium prioriisuperbiae TaxID=2854389 RepID=UPI0028E3A47E|nr:VWA domain-containing protein [Bradyrhizobium prioritasuperba]
MPGAQVLSLGDYRSGRRFAALLRDNSDLLAALHATLTALGRRGDNIDLARWDEILLGLLNANLGEATVRGFLRLTEVWPRDRSAVDLLATGEAARHVGREAGSRSAQVLLATIPKLLPRLPASVDLMIVSAALRQLAEVAPESVVLAIGRLEQLLASADAEDFAVWVSGGLRACGSSAARRRAYFGLDDALSKRLFALGRSGGDFTRLERRLSLTMQALWNSKSRFRKLVAADALPLQRRASLAAGLIGLPETFPGFEGTHADTIYLAAAAHAGAHLSHSGIRFPVGQLKPLQIALVSLIEDARVETLALNDKPGLRRLWLPFHTAEPSSQTTAAGLMTRLARALIDPAYDEGDAWVGKGRALFSAATERWSDPAISREIGGLLGNDLGQMRLQFNARSYVVEPVYRDDNLALWDFGDQPDAPSEEIELPVDSVRIERRDQPDGQQRADEAARSDNLRARGTVVTPPEGLPVATYPEWDYAAGIERPDWTTILEADAPVDRGGGGALPAETVEMKRITALAREASIGRRIRHRGQHDGDTLDIDAAIAWNIERRAGLVPEPRVYQRDAPGPRDLAIVLLLDLSQSTADRDRQGQSVLAIEREAARIVASAVHDAGDAIAVHGFNSDGRERVRYVRIKDFDEPVDGIVRARLAGLSSSHSTRLGPALRHAGRALALRRAFRRVLVVLTDGEPSDIDVQDPLYLAEDARRVVSQLRRRGVDTFAFGMGEGPFHQLDRIFGVRRALRVPRIAALPARIMQLYGELKK